MELKIVRGDELTDGLEAFIALQRAAEDRPELEPAEVQTLRGYWDHIYGKDSGQVFFGLAAGKPCAVAGIARFGKVASHLHAGRSGDAAAAVESLVLRSGIEWAKSVGCEWFSLDRMIPEKDIRITGQDDSVAERLGGRVIAVHGIGKISQLCISPGLG